MKNAVVTVAVGKALEWLEISEPTMRAYAEKVGAEFVKLTGVTCPPYPQGEKWQLYDQFDTFDRILFVDADIVIRPGATDLFELVPEDRVGIYDDLPDMPGGYAWYFAETEQVQRDQGASGQALPYCLNSGLVMSSRMHREIWRQPNFFRPTHCYEQHVINCRIRDAGFKLHRLSREIHWQWWSDKEGRHKAAAQFVHFSGMKDHGERIRLMREAVFHPASPVVRSGCSSCQQRRRAVR